MPQMKMNRNWRVPTLFGHTVVFPKGEPVFVPDDQRVIEACLSAGAEYVDASQAPTLPDMNEGKAQVALSNTQRKETIFALFEVMSANQAEHRENFTAFGRPNAKFVSSKVGFEVTAKEVEEFWTEFRAPK